MNLDRLGWDDFFEKHFAEYGNEELIPARILSQQKNNYTVCLENKSINAKLSGKFVYSASKRKHFPAVGDWTLIKLTENNSHAIIHYVLPRKTAFVRKLPISGGRKVKNGCIVGGTTEEQIIAANVDTVFIVCGLDGNFNLQRIERYITLAYNSGATPVIILNKVDCCEAIEEHVDKVRKIAAGLDIYPISVLKNIGMDIFDKYLLQGKTIVFIGSSGVGKSSVINYIIGEEKQRTNFISDFNGKGKHTTTSAELVFHNSGCMVIDTPGLRELQLWGEEDALNQNFDDIISIAKKCKYGDCRHDKEPGCAVKQSIEEGLISLERLENYKKQHYELVMLDGRIKQNEAYLSKGAKLHAKAQQDKRKGNFQRNKNSFKSF